MNNGITKQPLAVLAGNPNAGKTTLFNALTKSRRTTGNWHGVTTSAAYKSIKGITYADVPGMYSFDGFSMEEAEAAKEIKRADIVINVADSLTLSSALNLTRRIISLNPRTVLYVTKLKSLYKRGGKLNINLLSQMLGVPVVTDVKSLKNIIKNGVKNAIPPNNKIALNQAYYGGNCNLRRAEKLFYSPVGAPLIFLFSIIFMFFLAFYKNMPGEFLKGVCEDLICVKLGGVLRQAITIPVLRSLVCDGVVSGAGGVLSFIPQLAVLYLFLIILDESGIMSALSFVTDGLFKKVNLSGRAAFSLISGFGCTAAAILTTRGLTKKSAQKRTICSLAYVPCGAKLPVFLTFLSPLFANPFPAICAFYFAGVALSLIVSKLKKGGGEELLSEVTPIGFPSLKQVQIKLYFQLKGFIIKVVTTVMLFCFVSWFLSSFTFSLKYCGVQDSMLADITRALLPVFCPMGVTDWRLAYALLTGFAAKENIAATISMLYTQGFMPGFAVAMSASTFLLLSPACISAFSASCKEVGKKFTIKLFAAQLAFAFIASYVIYFLFSL